MDRTLLTKLTSAPTAAVFVFAVTVVAVTVVVFGRRMHVHQFNKCFNG